VRLVIDEDIVMNKLLKLKVDKAQGPDDIHPSVLRNCVQAAVLLMTIIYKKSLEEGILPNNNNNNDRLTAFDPGQPG